MKKHNLLTLKQEKFVNAYIMLGNGTEAAIKAGYTPNSADVQASRLLSKPHVAKAIEDKQAKLIAKTDLTLETWQAEVLKLARYGKSESIRLKAWELLGKNLGAYLDRMQIIDSMDDEQLNALVSELSQKIA